MSHAQQKDLQFYLQRARQNSPLLIDYDNQLKSAKLDSLLYRASYRPQIGFNANVNYAPIINGYGYDEVISNGQTVSALLGINQKILGGNATRAKAESYALLRQSVTSNRSMAVKDLRKSITGQYIVAWGTAQQVRLNAEIVNLLSNEDSVLRKLARHSVYKQTDYLIFNATLRQQQLTALQLSSQYQNDLALLNYLSGETDSTTIGLKDPDLTPPSRSNHKAFVRQFEVDSLKLVNANRIAAAAYRPSLSLLGDAGYLSSLTYEAQKNFGFSVGLGLTIPIYDGGQRKIELQKSDLALQTIGAYHNNFNRQYRQQLRMLQLKILQADEVDKLLKSQLVVAEALIDANRKLLVSGDAQITEYVIALSNLINIRMSLASNQVTRLQAMNEINYWTSDE